MKNLGLFFSVISTALAITACEKSPERIFDMAAIPGIYQGYIDVLAPDSTAWKGWAEVSRIPEDYNAKISYRIQKVKENEFTLTFGRTDTILPETITFEISRFEEHSYNEIDAYIKVSENDLWQRSSVRNFGMGDGINNQFRYCDCELRSTISFIFVLKSKIRDDLIIVCHGQRYYN